MITGKAKEDCRYKGQLTLRGHVLTVPEEYKHLIEPEVLDKVEVAEEEVKETIVAKVKKTKKYSRKKK